MPFDGRKNSMVRLLYTLPDRIQRKSIYIWNVDKDSITEFTKLALRQINIKGFVTQELSYIGERYMNRPVVSVAEALQEENVLIILSEKCDRSKIPEEINQNAFLFSEVSEIDARLKEKKVYIYGAGIGGKEIYKELKKNKIETEAFCVTHKDNENAMIEDKKVCQIDEIDQKDNSFFIVSALHEKSKQEMVDMLDAYGVEMYVRDFLNDDIIQVISLFQSIHKAWNEKKKIYIYTRTRGGYCKLIEKTLELYGIGIDGYVCQQAVEELGIKEAYDLAYEDVENIYVLINDLEIVERKDQIAVYSVLEEIGLSISAFNYAGFHPVTTNDWNGHDQNTPDPLLGWSMVYENKKLPGVRVIGNMGEDDIRIVVLGGSTSTDGILRTTCWVRFLYQRLLSNGVRVTIYDCAGAGEDVFQELLSYIRDGMHFQPQYVISMSGVNNRSHLIRGVENKANLKHTVEWYKVLSPKAPCVCGIPVREDAFAYWLRIQKIMKAVVEMNGSKYYCFLQPIKEAKENLSIFEKSVHFSGDADNEAASFRMGSRKDDFYINLLSLFDDKEGMFTDICHYSEEANKILADIVYEHILKDL